MFRAIIRPEQFNVSAINDGETDRGERMAHAAGHYYLRLPDRRNWLRTTRGAWPFSHTDVVGLQLGPRRVRACASHPGSDLGRGDSLRRRHRRPLRFAARAVDRGGAVLLRTRADVLFNDAGHARSLC